MYFQIQRYCHFEAILGTVADHFVELPMSVHAQVWEFGVYSHMITTLIEQFILSMGEKPLEFTKNAILSPF